MHIAVCICKLSTSIGKFLRCDMIYKLFVGRRLGGVWRGKKTRGRERCGMGDTVVLGRTLAPGRRSKIGCNLAAFRARRGVG